MRCLPREHRRRAHPSPGRATVRELTGSERTPSYPSPPVSAGDRVADSPSDCSSSKRRVSDRKQTLRRSEKDRMLPGGQWQLWSMPAPKLPSRLRPALVDRASSYQATSGGAEARGRVPDSAEMLRPAAIAIFACTKPRTIDSPWPRNASPGMIARPRCRAPACVELGDSDAPLIRDFASSFVVAFPCSL